MCAGGETAWFSKSWECVTFSATHAESVAMDGGHGDGNYVPMAGVVFHVHEGAAGKAIYPDRKAPDLELALIVEGLDFLESWIREGPMENRRCSRFNGSQPRERLSLIISGSIDMYV